jgi:hypothetical protein
MRMGEKYCFYTDQYCSTLLRLAPTPQISLKRLHPRVLLPALRRVCGVPLLTEHEKHLLEVIGKPVDGEGGEVSSPDARVLNPFVCLTHLLNGEFVAGELDVTTGVGGGVGDGLSGEVTWMCRAEVEREGEEEGRGRRRKKEKRRTRKDQPHSRYGKKCGRMHRCQHTKRAGSSCPSTLHRRDPKS